MTSPCAQEREGLLQGRSFLLKDTFWKLNHEADGSDVCFSRVRTRENTGLPALMLLMPICLLDTLPC